MKSSILSAFHDKEIEMYAAVILPKGYHTAADVQSYPTVYYIEGNTFVLLTIFKLMSVVTIRFYWHGGIC